MKGMDSTLSLLVAIVVGLMVVVVLIAIFGSNTGSLENFALEGVDVNFWGGD